MPSEPMTHPDDDVLADAATADGPDAQVARHLAGCPRCRAVVDDLRRVGDLLREGGPELVAPPASVRAAVDAAVDADTGGRPGSVSPLREPAPADEPARRRGSRVSPWWLAAAVVVGVLLGGLGRGWVDDAPSDQGRVLARTSLAPPDGGGRVGSADVVEIGTHVDLDVTATGLDPGPGYLEVWLINRDLSRMVSVGVLRPGTDHQLFAVPADVLRQGYVIVDISREGFDDRPEHSGDSLVRGTLAL